MNFFLHLFLLSHLWTCQALSFLENRFSNGKLMSFCDTTILSHHSFLWWRYHKTFLKLKQQNLELLSFIFMLAFHQTIACLSDNPVKTLPCISLIPFYDGVCFPTTAILASKQQFRSAVEAKSISFVSGRIVFTSSHLFQLF